MNNISILKDLINNHFKQIENLTQQPAPQQKQPALQQKQK
jgi:hypothetical protein